MKKYFCLSLAFLLTGQHIIYADNWHIKTLGADVQSFIRSPASTRIQIKKDGTLFVAYADNNQIRLQIWNITSSNLICSAISPNLKAVDPQLAHYDLSIDSIKFEKFNGIDYAFFLVVAHYSGFRTSKQVWLWNITQNNLLKVPIELNVNIPWHKIGLFSNGRYLMIYNYMGSVLIDIAPLLRGENTFIGEKFQAFNSNFYSVTCDPITGSFFLLGKDDDQTYKVKKCQINEGNILLEEIPFGTEALPFFNRIESSPNKNCLLLTRSFSGYDFVSVYDLKDQFAMFDLSPQRLTMSSYSSSGDWILIYGRKTEPGENFLSVIDSSNAKPYLSIRFINNDWRTLDTKIISTSIPGVELFVLVGQLVDEENNLKVITKLVSKKSIVSLLQQRAAGRLKSNNIKTQSNFLDSTEYLLNINADNQVVLDKAITSI